MTRTEIVSFIWSVANLLRDSFKRSPSRPYDGSLRADRKDNRVTHAALKTIAAFLNTEGGDLLLRVADGGSVVGIEKDGLDNDDKCMPHLTQLMRNGLGDRGRRRSRMGTSSCGVGWGR